MNASARSSGRCGRALYREARGRRIEDRRSALPRCPSRLVNQRRGLRKLAGEAASSHDRLTVTDEPVDPTLSPVLEESTGGYAAVTIAAAVSAIHMLPTNAGIP